MKKTILIIKTIDGDREVKVEKIIPGLYIHKNPRQGKFVKKWVVSNQQGLRIFGSACSKKEIFKAVREHLSGLNWNVLKAAKKHNKAIEGLPGHIILGGNPCKNQ